MRATDIPLCPKCQHVARPNILMFGDYSWLYQRTALQEDHFDGFLQNNSGKQLVVIEIGAGSAIPTIRNLSERLGRGQHARVLRINPREAQINPPHISFSGGALEILQQIQSQLNS